MARAAKRRAVPRRRRRAGNRGRIPDSQQLAGIKQGVGRAVARAFGSAPIRRRRNRGRGMGYHPCMHDAFHFCHLPLPRPTGPYIVIRTTQLIESSDKLLILGPAIGDDGNWCNTAGYGVVDINKTFSAGNNINQYVFDSMQPNNASWNGSQVTPAAFSVQLMNPNALQTTNGIVYAGRLRTAWKITQNLNTAAVAMANQFISYNNPRLLSAAKLAFRGTQTDCVPFNMSELADFTSQDRFTEKVITASSTTPDQKGFAPQFYYNPNGINLQYLVCCEWRVRFDPTNPAQASHIQHTHADENVWMKCLHFAEAAGNGVVDIADRVAQTGNAVFGAAASAYRAGRGMRAITAGVGQLALA